MAAEACNFDLQVAEFLMSDSMMNLSNQVSAVSGQIGSWAAGIATAGCALYSVLWVVAFATGSQNGDLFSFFKWFARALFLIVLGGTGSVYNEYVVTTLWETPAEVAQIVSGSGMGNQSIRYDAEGKINMGTALDQAASKGICAGTALWKATSAWKPIESQQYFIAGLVVIIGTVIFVALAAGLAFMGYASLAIVLSLGPMFIIAGIWEATRPMMESFLRTAFNYALYGVVLMVIVGLGIGLVQQFGSSTIGSIGENTVVDLAAAMSVSIRALFAFGIASALLFKADDISASLVGGISMGAAGTLSRAMNTATSPAKAAMAAGRIAMNPARAAGEFMGGTFFNDPRTGAARYRGPIDTARNHASALASARAKNTIRK